MASLKEGDWIKLQILKVESPGCIWARMVQSEHFNELKAFEKLHEDINLYFNDCETQKIPIRNPIHHQISIARRNADRVWYRVRVEDRIGKAHMYSCFLLDEGSQDVFNQEWLRVAPPLFMKVPFQAQRYQLDGVKPLSLTTASDTDFTVTKQPSRCWDPIATSMIKKYLKDQPTVEAEVLQVRESELVGVRLYVGPDSLCLNDQLVKEKYGYSTRDQHASGKSSGEMDLVSKSCSQKIPSPVLGLQGLHLTTHITQATTQTSQSTTDATPPTTQATQSSTYTTQSITQTTQSITQATQSITQTTLPTTQIPQLTTQTAVEAVFSLGIGRGVLGKSKLGRCASMRPEAWGDPIHLRGPALQSPGRPGRGKPVTASFPGLVGITPLRASQPGECAQVQLPAGSEACQPKGLGLGRGRGMALLREGWRGAADCPVPSPLSAGDNVSSSPPQPAQQGSGHSPSAQLNRTVPSVAGTDTVPIWKPALPPASEVAESGVPPKVAASVVPPKVAASGFPPELAASSVASDVATSGVPPEVVASAVPLKVAASDVPPKVAASDVPPKVTASGVAPEVAESGVPPGGAAFTTRELTDGETRPLLESRLPRFVQQAVSVQHRLATRKQPAGGATSQPDRHRSGSGSDCPESPRTRLRAGSGIMASDGAERLVSSLERDESSVHLSGVSNEGQLLRFKDDSESDADQQISLYTDQEAPSAETLGVLLDGEVLPSFIQNTKVLFDTAINQVIDRLDIMPTNIQSYCWPALLRMRNVVGVASAYRHTVAHSGRMLHQGGSTVAYLIPLVSQLKQEGMYAGVPAGVGPLALILCSGSRRVNEVFEQVQTVCKQNVSLSVIRMYGGMGPDHKIQEVRLCNGCQLLITTPRCLLGMLTRDKPIIEMTRLCHLVIEDGSKLLEFQKDEVTELLTRYEDCMKADMDRAMPHQVVLISKNWTPRTRDFMTSFMPEPTVVIASMAQGAIYCQVQKINRPVLSSDLYVGSYFIFRTPEVKYLGRGQARAVPDVASVHNSAAEEEQRVKGGAQQIVRVVRADQRLSLLSELLTHSTQRKTIIFTDSPATALAVHDSLHQFSVQAILCHENLTLVEINKAVKDWATPFCPKSPHVLVLTDDMLAESWVHDAELVVHYDPPTRKQYFGSRLWCMFENFTYPLQPSEKAKGTTSILYVTEEWKAYMNLVIRDLRNSEVPVPDELLALAEQLVLQSERHKYTPLCRQFKAFGRCSMSYECKARHSIQRHLDSPGTQKMHQVLPTSGDIKVLVMWVEDATRLWVRLLEHRAPEGTKNLCFCNLTLSTDMACHYGNEENHTPCDYPVVDELYVIKDKQHVYNRVRVLSIKHKYNTKVIEEVQVRLVDVGSTTWVAHTSLLVLDLDMRKIPFQAVEVYVCGVKPLDEDLDWTKHASNLIYEDAYAEQLDGRIVLALGNTLWLDPLVKREVLREVGTVTHSVVLHRSLLDNDLALPNHEHMLLLYQACLNNVDMPDVLSLHNVAHMAYDVNGLPTTLRTQTLPQDLNIIPVQVTAVLHPDLFYARLTQNVEKLNELHTEIQDYIQVHQVSEKAMSLLKPGSLILATSPQDDADEELQLWYRAKLQDVTPSEYDVFYLDTGESEFVARDQVRPLPQCFTHWPFQALECRLPHILPPEGEDWDEDEVGDQLWQMVSYNVDNTPLPLSAQVVSSSDRAVNIGWTKYALRLFDPNKEFDIDISQELVAQGYGRPTKEMIEAEMPPVDENVAAPYQNMATLCTELVLSTVDKQIVIIDQIQKLIRGHQHDVEGMCQSRAVGALCVALGFLHLSAGNLSIGELLCSCLVLLTKLSPSVFNAILRDDGVTTLCRMLARSNSEGHQVVLHTIVRLVKQSQLREQFVRRGMLRLLSPLLYATEPEEREATVMLKLALAAMRELVQALGERHRIAVVRSGCVQALCHQLEHSEDPDDLVDVLQTLNTLFVKVRIQEESRRWAAPSLCSRLTTAAPPVVSHVVLTLASFTQRSRINKEAVLEYGIIGTLKKLSATGSLSPEAQTDCVRLQESLSILKGAADYPEVSPHRGDSPGPEEEARDSDSERNTGRQLDGYRNVPIPREDLHTIKAKRYPPVTWFQDRRNLVLLVQVKNVTGNLLCDIKPRDLKFQTMVDQVEYMLEFRLYEEINPDRCETKVTPGEVRIGLRKVTPGKWPRVIQKCGKLPYLSPDFERYIEESDSDSETDAEFVTARNNESPLDIMKRCCPRPRGIPPPTTEYSNPSQSDYYHPVDPADSPDYQPPFSDDEDKSDAQDLVDEQDEDAQRQFFNL